MPKLPDKESDLFLPIKQYLEQQGYKVRAEVKNCDITATKDDELIVIELKKRFSIDLIIQATDRQRITDSVYIAIPGPIKHSRKNNWKGKFHVLKRLEIGLISVSFETLTPEVVIHFHPIPFNRRRNPKRKRAVIKEIHSRSENLNKGGSSKKKIVTAYREQAIHIAYYLKELGPSKPKLLKSMGTIDKTGAILSSNFYGWFERVDYGVYRITPKGEKALNSYPELIYKYKAILNEIRNI